MAPGVGKTLQDAGRAPAEADSGRDEAIGYLEPHGRRRDRRRGRGLPDRCRGARIAYRGKPLEEMDLPGVLARKPELCLIDELAHTNAPGVEHEKRFQDVRDRARNRDRCVLDRQRAASGEPQRPDRPANGDARVRETVPDSVLSMAPTRWC